MSSTYDDKIEDILENSELAKCLVPNKFKFTSQQGRLRRQKLLAAAKELSETRRINQITLADVCERAGIPRASAYHFFPNVQAVFLALRFLNATEIFTGLQSVEARDYNSWQEYVTAMTEKAMQVTQVDPTVARLIYETNTPEFEFRDFNSDIEKRVVELVYKKLSEVYKMPAFDDIQKQLLIAFSIVKGIYTVGYRQEGKLTKYYYQEAVTAVLSYLQNHLPKELPRQG